VYERIEKRRIVEKRTERVEGEESVGECRSARAARTEIDSERRGLFWAQSGTDLVAPAPAAIALNPALEQVALQTRTRLQSLRALRVPAQVTADGTALDGVLSASDASCR